MLRLGCRWSTTTWSSLDVAVGGHAAMVQPVDPAQEPAGVTTSTAARRLPRILVTTEVDQLTTALHA